MKKAFEFLPLVIVILVLYAFANMANANPLNRKAVNSILDNTVISEFGPAHDMTLEEIMKALTDISKKQLNFLYFKKKSRPQTPSINNQNIINPATGLPFNNFPQPLMPANPFNGLPMVNTNIAINPLAGLPMPQAQELNPEPRVIGMKFKIVNVTLRDLINIIVMSLNTPMNYTVMNYGIVFTADEKQKAVGGPTLFTRKFYLNPRAQKALGALGNSRTNNNPNINK
tara:strand:- start:651 stop:1334 length:684 start_codon:yes stop_codon:yes gene_type:complete